MKHYLEVASDVQAGKAGDIPSGIAKFIMEEAQGEANELYLLRVFLEVFPEIPFGLAKNATFRFVVCNDEMNDKEFDDLLSPWVKFSE